MRHNRITWIASLLIFLTLLLSGCWDSVEIDDQCYLLFLAVDATEKGGVQLTTEPPSANPQIDMSPEEKSKHMVTVAGRDLFEAMDTLYAGLPLNVNLSQLKVVYVSEEIAQSEGFSKILSDLLALRGIRKMASIIVCEGRADSFTETLRPFGDMQLSKSLEIAITSYQESSYLAHSRLQELYQQMRQTHSTGMTGYGTVSKEYKPGTTLDYYGNEDAQPGNYYAVDLPHRGVVSTELFGTALFDDTHMAMKLTGYEAQLLSFLRGEGTHSLLSISPQMLTQAGIEGDRMDIIIETEENPSIHAHWDGSRYIFTIDLPLEATLTKSFDHDYDLNILEQAALDIFHRDASALLEKLHQAGLDPVNLADVAIKDFLTIQEWEAFGWEGAYQNAEIVLNTSLYLHWPSKEPGGLSMYFQ